MRLCALGSAREQRPGLRGEGVLGAVRGCRGATRSSRVDRLSCSACSMASTGVTPTPALTSTTGSAPSSSMNRPRGAATSMSVPTSTHGAQVSAGRSVRFDLDADPVTRPRRVVLTASSCARAVAPAPGSSLRVTNCPGSGGGERRAVVGARAPGTRRWRSPALRDDPQGAETRPGRRGSQRRQTSVAACRRAAALLLEQRLQRGLPARAEGGDPQRPLQQLRVGASVQVEQALTSATVIRLGPGRRP